MIENNQDVYDTTIYTDFADLPDITRKALYAEWTDKFPAEKKLSRFCRLLPLIFAMLTAGFLIASGIVALAVGFDIPCIILLVFAIATLVACLIFNERSARLMYAQSIRYSDWLKKEKRILAEIKPKKSNKKTD